MTVPEISVIICTHNPRADYLRAALDGLRAQTLDHARWELLLIDNESATPLEQTFDLGWQPRGRIIREAQLGLTPARLRGIRESTGALLVFVDDDNVLAPDYLALSLEIAEQWPQLGSWGGQTIGVFEETPEPWMREHFTSFAVREFERDLWSNYPLETGALPYGAGLSVRRAVAENYARLVESEPLRRSLDRHGTRLLGGGDTDLCLTACEMGLGNGLFARLKLQHLIAKSRVSFAHLLKLHESMTYSDAFLMFLHGVPPAERSRSQRIFDWYRWSRIPQRDREFEQARARGRDAAARDIAALKSQTPSPAK
jgi:glycosyltransferase involved in cell wall biosynthesis